MISRDLSVCPRDGRELLEIEHPERPDVVIEDLPELRGVLLDAGELRQISGEEAASWLKKMRKVVDTVTATGDGHGHDRR